MRTIVLLDSKALWQHLRVVLNFHLKSSPSEKIFEIPSHPNYNSCILESYIRHKDFRPFSVRPSVTLRVPPLDSELGIFLLLFLGEKKIKKISGFFGEKVIFSD